MGEAIAVNSGRAFLLACRPKTLGAIGCPMLVGTSVAIIDGNFNSAIFAITFVCAVLLQILANLINDYGDFLKGSDTSERLGPPRAMQMGFLTESAMKKAIAVTLLAAILLGLVLVAHGGLPVLLMGVIGIFLCGWYTLTDKPLSHLGFAEVVIFFLFGPGVVIGAFYVQALSSSPVALAASLSSGFLSTALLLTNNLRDVVLDGKNRKLTIAVRFGHRFSRIAVVVMVLLAMSSPVLLMLGYGFSWPVLVCGAALILPARHFGMILNEPITARFNLMLAAVGKCLYLFGILFSLGIVYGAP